MKALVAHGVRWQDGPDEQSSRRPGEAAVSRRGAAWFLLAAVVLSSCSAVGGRDDPPLETSRDRHEVCAQQPPDGLVTFGVDVTQNTSSGPVTIEKVSLQKPVGMSLIGAKVAMYSDPDALLAGVHRGWPPPPEELREATDAEGAVVPAGARTVSFIAGVKAVAGGRSGPPKVTYEDSDGRSHTWNGMTSYRTSKSTADPCE